MSSSLWGTNFLSGIRMAITREKQEQSHLEARHSFINPNLQWYPARDKHLAVRRTFGLCRTPFFYLPFDEQREQALKI